jgi:hypothetical protein
MDCWITGKSITPSLLYYSGKTITPPLRDEDFLHHKEAQRTQRKISIGCGQLNFVSFVPLW